MYEVKATLPAGKGVGDQILDELVALFEAHGQDCTCGLIPGAVVGYVEEDMLSPVTTLLLKYVPKVEVRVVVEDEELAAV